MDRWALLAFTQAILLFKNETSRAASNGRLKIREKLGRAPYYCTIIPQQWRDLCPKSYGKPSTV
eukprot:scaffold521_cov167-Amphora_coffeaeformis.AAC.16